MWQLTENSLILKSGFTPHCMPPTHSGHNAFTSYKVAFDTCDNPILMALPCHGSFYFYLLLRKTLLVPQISKALQLLSVIVRNPLHLFVTLYLLSLGGRSSACDVSKQEWKTFSNDNSNDQFRSKYTFLPHLGPVQTPNFS